MNRVMQQQAELVAATLGYIPSALADRVACDVFCGDPIFAGLHATIETDDGRSYRDLAHVCFPCHTADKRLTLVLPRPEEQTTGIYVGLHEMGHVLHWTLQDRAGGWSKVPRLEPVSEYAASNIWEEFAEAFAAWFYLPRQVETDRYWRCWSRSNDEFFDHLAVGA